MTIQEAFIKFLKLNNYYEQYIFNFNVQKDWHRCESLDEFLNKHFYYNYAYVYVFDWDKTKEGHKYWKNVDIKWTHYYKQHIKNICKLERI
jgi:hypothetical protein